MNDDAYQPDALDELPGDLRIAVERLKQRPIPEAAMERALERAARCGSASRWSDRRLRFKAVLGLAAAAAACVALGLWFSRPSDLWAEVVKAVQAKPWIHGIGRVANPDAAHEFWIATSRGIGAMRSEEEIAFFDYRQRIVDRYEPQKGILCRLPASKEELAQGQQFLETLQGMVRGDAQLKAEHSGMILKQQHHGQAEIEGRIWDEYELVFRVPSSPDADFRETFVVDPETRLPSSLTMKGIDGRSLQIDFDYPETGPADIYALGVPKDAKLVDRMPTGDMARMLAAIQAGRERFDDFHAIVIRGGSPDALAGPGLPVPLLYLVWKKGNRWRVEVGIPSQEFVSGRALEGKDQTERRREACQKAHFRPSYVCDGKAAYKGDDFKLVSTAHTATWLCMDAMRAMPGAWCYPITFPSPNERTEETVNLEPAEGPPKTVLITSHLIDAGADTIPWQRFWLDPLRGFAVARHDFLRANPAAKPPTNRDQQDLMDGWQQTPSGVWYPTRVGTGSPLGELKTGATWYHFFLDFSADMPDELFQPARRTVLTDRYPVDP